MDEDVYAPRMDLPEQSQYSPEEKKGFFEKLRENLIDFIQSLVVFGAIFAIIYLFVAQPHKVSGTSMVPNFQNGDYILTDKVSYRFRSPAKAEVIVLKNPRNPSQDFIKRIIALPEDIIKVEGNTVFVNGVKVSETYLPPGTFTRSGSFLKEGETIKVGASQFFVLGDNREHSSDSREWGGIIKKEIVGRVFFRYWPPSAAGILKSPL